MTVNNTLLHFFETYCHCNYEVACYYLNTDENTLTDLMGYDDDFQTSKSLLHIAKSKLAFDIPKSETDVLAQALKDAIIRVEEWENNTLNLLRGGDN